MKRLRDMTADELTQARKDRLPLFCQTMQRHGVINYDEIIYSDVEELSLENLQANLAEYRVGGWKPAGVMFIRNPKEEALTTEPEKR